MKINMDISPEHDDLEINIKCKKLTPEIERLLSNIRMMEHNLPVSKGDETFLLPIEEIGYLESVDRKCFVYTTNEVYESELKLYEMEEQLKEQNFIRINKSCILNMKMIGSLKADIDRKLRIRLKNGEQLIASRMYAEDLRKALGLK